MTLLFKFRIFVAALGILTGIFLYPPVFQRYFSMAPLLSEEKNSLWIVTISLILVSLFLVFTSHRRKIELALFYCSVLFLFEIELIARFITINLLDETKPNIERMSLETYPSRAAYIGHPFLHFIGNPSVSLIGNDILGNLYPFNNFGFVGKDFSYQKSKDIVRIACLGASTTMSGYPQMMEEYLNQKTAKLDKRFESMNFGIGHYTSAHNLVNFVLNVVDFEPDYVIIHLAWNDGLLRSHYNGQFRNDYSHIYKTFELPVMPDKYVIRISVLYRLFKIWIGKETYLRTLEEAVNKHRDGLEYPKWNSPDELKPYERNIRTIVELAILKGFTVILTTQPHSTQPDVPGANSAPHMDQANNVMREILHSYRSKVLFVDLDRMMTGKVNNLFKDLGHLNKDGRKIKAEEIGNIILKDVLAKQ